MRAFNTSNLKYTLFFMETNLKDLAVLADSNACENEVWDSRRISDT